MAGDETPRVTGVDVHADRLCEDPTTHAYLRAASDGGRFFVRIGELTLHLDDDYAERLVIMLQAARRGEFTETPDEQSFESATL